ncbi:MAG TPA: hypothetical protein VFN10_08040 [Thermoanaerobaculia bacterium]|nr:hypothetical protein [Thermoanaerobaculia bacterium]
MKAFLHVCALLLALPQIFLAAAFLLLNHAANAGSFGGFVDRALDIFLALFSWGGLLLLATLTLLFTAAFIASWRPFGAAALALLVLGSASSLIVQLGAPQTPATFTLLLPGFASLALSAYLMADAWRRAPVPIPRSAAIDSDMAGRA